MQLPEVLEPGGFFNNVPRGGSSSLLGSVIHERDSGRDSVYEYGAVALVPAVMRHNIDIDLPQFVLGTHQLHFLVSGQVAKIPDSELAKCNQRPERTNIFRLVRRKLLRRLAASILFS